MRKHSIIIIFFLFTWTSAFASDEGDQSLKDLDNYIGQREHYIQLRENRINILKQRVTSINDDTERFEI